MLQCKVFLRLTFIEQWSGTSAQNVINFVREKNSSLNLVIVHRGGPRSGASDLSVLVVRAERSDSSHSMGLGSFFQWKAGDFRLSTLSWVGRVVPNAPSIGQTTSSGDLAAGWGQPALPEPASHQHPRDRIGEGLTGAGEDDAAVGDLDPALLDEGGERGSPALDRFSGCCYFDNRPG